MLLPLKSRKIVTYILGDEANVFLGDFLGQEGPDSHRYFDFLGLGLLVGAGFEGLTEVVDLLLYLNLVLIQLHSCHIVQLGSGVDHARL